MSTHRSLVLMLALAVLWALEEALTGMAAARLPVVQVIWSRFALHLLLIVLWSGWRGLGPVWRTGRPGLQVLRSMMLLGMPAFWLLGMTRGVDGDTLLAIFWLSPLLIPLLAWLLLGERMEASLSVAAAVASAGAAALIGPDEMQLPALRLLVFPIGMALSFSLYVVMTRVLRGEAVHTNLFYAALGVFVALLPLVPLSWVTPTWRELALLLGVASLGIGGLFALERLAADAPVSRLAPVLGLQLPVAFGIAWLRGLESFTANVLVGLLAIGAAACFAWRRHARPAAPTGMPGIAAVLQGTVPAASSPLGALLQPDLPWLQRTLRLRRKRGHQ